MQLLHALTLLPVLAAAAPAQDPAPRPDVVVILADDMGYSDIGCFGGEIRTPHLDRLAADGLRFTHFYNSARCCPTRASLLTGLHPHQAGVGWMMADSGTDAYRGELAPNAVTIAEALGPAGYGTFMSGKWHVTRGVTDDAPRDNWPRGRGFDRHFGTIHGAGSLFDPNSLTLDDELIVPGEGFYYTDAIADWAVRFVEQHDDARPDDPLFLYVAFTAPHWPMHAPEDAIEPYRGRYDAGWDALREERLARMAELGLVDERWGLTQRDGGVPAWGDEPDAAWHASRMEVYAAMVDRLDAGVGRLLAALEARGRLENTLVLFLADNGGCAEEYGSTGPLKLAGELASEGEVAPQPMTAGELQSRMIPRFTREGRPVRTGHGVVPGPPDTYVAYGKGWANASNTPFRRYKHWVHEGGIATPFIAHWPAGIARRGELDPTPGHVMDVMATCLDVAGAEYPTERAGQTVTPVEGLSLAPVFRGQRLAPRALCFEHEGNRAVRAGDLKLVAAGAGGPWELYDLAADRTERVDLASGRPADVERLEGIWTRWAERCGVTPLTPYWAPRDEVFSSERVFTLRTGDRLERAEAPNVRARPFQVRATVASTARDGVIVAQGGGSHGWALHLDRGVPVLSVRREGQLADVRAAGAPASAVYELVATVGFGGELSLRVVEVGRPEHTTTAPGVGLLTQMPVDGLEVGRDEDGAVGRYSPPSPLAGEFEVVIRLLGG